MEQRSSATGETSQMSRAPRTPIPARVRELSRGVLPLFLSLGLLNASNYIFHVAISRLLGPSEYGGLAALLAVMMVISVPVSVAQTVVAKRTAILRAEGRGDEVMDMAVATSKGLTRVAVLGLLGLLVVSPLLADFLNAGLLPTALLGGYWLFSTVLAAPVGVLQGNLRFAALGGVVAFGILGRLVAGIGLVMAGLGVTGAILGTVIAQVLSFLLAIKLLAVPRERWSAAVATLSVFRGDFRTALFTLGSFWLLAEIDLVLARRYLEPTEAGHYASAGLIARALLFLPTAVSMVALPRFAEARHGEQARRRLNLAVGVIVALLLAAYPLLVVSREWVISLAFGDQFAPAADLLPLLAAGMALLGLVGLFAHFHVAEGTRAYRLVLCAVAVEGALIVLAPSDAYSIGTVVLGTAALTAVVQYHAALSAARWRPGESQLVTGSTVRALKESPSLDVSVVLPCYNAGGGLRGVLESLREVLPPTRSWEIVVVSDGSTDDTVAIAQEFVSDNVRLVPEPIRIGKGHALRVGLAQARGRYVAFMDADGDIDPHGIGPALALTELYEPDMVLGSKRHPMSEVHYPPLRRVLSWTYHKLCRLLFRVNVRDTQTGFKLIRRDVLAAVLPRMLEKRYAFDLEFLVVARSCGYARVFEAPITINYRFDSRVNVGATIRILIDTLAVFYRRYVLDSYKGDDGGPLQTSSHPSAPAPLVTPAAPPAIPESSRAAR